MSKIFVGAKVQNLDIGAEVANITRVNLVVDSENMYTAGNDTGRTMEVECPWGTQAMANSILASVGGVQYKPYSAERALLDPAFEPGDAVTIGGVYSQIINADCTYNGAALAAIEAPELDEIDDEYPVQQTQQSSIKRQLAYTRSLITKTAEQIRLEVANEIDGLSSSFAVELNEIRSEISGKIDEDAANSLISQKMDSIELSVSSANGSTTFTLTSDGAALSTKTLELSVDAVNITGKLTADQINATGLKVDAANVTGTLTIGQMPDGVATTDSIASEVKSVATSQGYVTASGVLSVTQNAGYVTSNQVTTITNNAISTASISANQITTGTLDASALELDGLLWLTKNGYGYGFMGVNVTKGGPVISDAGGNVFIVTTENAAKLSYHEQNMIWVASGTNGCYSSKTMQVYSDQRMKNSIDYGMEKYESMFQALKPCTYKYNNEGENARVRFGFVAQEVMAAAADNGLTENDYSLVGEYDGMYTIGYGEMAAWNTYMIQKLMARVSELEGKVNVI